MKNVNTFGEIIIKMDISSFIKDNKLKIIVKVNSPKSEITGWDPNRNGLKVAIKAEPEKGKEIGRASCRERV